MGVKKRSGKFYSKHEKEIMKDLGLKPTLQSGAGWIEKEDGYNEEILAQLKSTDADSYKFNYFDWQKLLYHANTEHKLPLFVLDFMQQDEQLLILRKEDLKDITLSLLGVEKIKDLDYNEKSEIEVEALKPTKKKQIKSSKKAREKFYEEKEKRYKEWQKKKC